jgi:integrase
VRRNVALLCEAPRGTQGRPSKSLTLHQATKLLAAAEGTSMNAYIVLALLIGARTEELPALTWDRLDLDGKPPTIQVWRAPSVAMAG